MGHGSAVARRIGQRHAHGLRTATELAEIGGWQHNLPVAVLPDYGGVGFTVQRDGHGLAAFADRADAVEHLILPKLRHVQTIVTGQRQHRQRWRDGIHHGGINHRSGVTGGIAGANGNRQLAVREGLQVGDRNSHFPVAVAIDGSLIGFAPHVYRDMLAAAGDAGIAAQGLRRGFIIAVEEAVAKGLRQRRLRQMVNLHVQGVLIQRKLVVKGDACGDDHRAILQLQQVSGRNSDAPVARLINVADHILFTVEGDDQGRARSGNRCYAAHFQRQGRFGGAQVIIGRENSDSDAGLHGINSDIGVVGDGVAVAINNADIEGVIPLRQRPEIPGGKDSFPASIPFNLRIISFAIKGDGHNLPGGHVHRLPGKRLVEQHFCRVNDIVAGQLINGDGGRREIGGEGALLLGYVARGINNAVGNGIAFAIL